MRTIIVAGMPRSGTSWLGQIVNSHPGVAFRTEPLFSYRFKNILHPSSLDRDIEAFFASLLDSGDDDFMMQRHLVLSGGYPSFSKERVRFLAYKTSRHHELLETFLTSSHDIRPICIVRHPCGAINSWINSRKEFLDKGCVVSRDWRSGACRKDGVGEYWGFNDWISTTKLFLNLESRYPEFTLIKYSDLVREPYATTRKIFEDVGLTWSGQTEEFLVASHSEHDSDPYSVYKDRSVIDRWKNELDRGLVDEIFYTVKKEGLEMFLD